MLKQNLGGQRGVLWFFFPNGLYVSDFQLEKRYTRPQTQDTIFICFLDHAYQAPFPNMKIERQGWPKIPLMFIWGSPRWELESVRVPPHRLIFLL